MVGNVSEKTRIPVRLFQALSPLSEPVNLNGYKAFQPPIFSDIIVRLHPRIFKNCNFDKCRKVLSEIVFFVPPPIQRLQIRQMSKGIIRARCSITAFHIQRLQPIVC